MVVTQRQKGTIGDMGESVGLDGCNAVVVEVNFGGCRRYIRWNCSQSALCSVVTSIAAGFTVTFTMSMAHKHHQYQDNSGCEKKRSFSTDRLRSMGEGNVFTGSVHKGVLPFFTRVSYFSDGVCHFSEGVSHFRKWETTSPTPSNTGIQSMRGWCASYSNAYLFCLIDKNSEPQAFTVPRNAQHS